MSDDLVKRLRVDDPWCQPKCDQAADRIEELEAKLERAVEALKPFATHVDKSTCIIKMVWQDGDYVSTYTNTLKPAHFETARSTLVELNYDERSEKKGQDDE